jgi:hypothetical protein
MFKKFISLEWKQFKRSKNFEKSLIIKIFMGLGILYFLFIAVAMGAGMYFGLKKGFPDQDPWVMVNKYFIFWFFAELVFRYLIQKMPVLSIKPLLMLPISKNKIIHYGLGKSLLSVFNFVLLFILIPFIVVLLMHGYPILNVLAWFLGMMMFSYTLNFIIFLVNKNDKAFYSILIILVSLVALEYFNIFKISVLAGSVFNYFSNHVFAIIIPVSTLVASYFISYKHLEKHISLDDLETKAKDVKTTDLSWLNRFGDVAPFLKNDLKLIWRNARPKKTVLSGAIFLFYALYFIMMEKNGVKSGMNNPYMMAFAMMFVTGGFAMTFGQLVPSWDSEYYQLLMSQNIKYKTYLESKWYLMGFAVIISFVLATPYIYFGWKIYGLLVAGMFFNLGINSYLVLFGGSLLRMPIKLNEKAKAFGNTQGFKMSQILISLPKVFLPIILFAIPNYFWGFNAGVLTIVILGIIGVLMKDYFLTKIEKIYQKTKYKTIAAYNEKD